jgi:hypothetical protein
MSHGRRVFFASSCGAHARVSVRARRRAARTPPRLHVSPREVHADAIAKHARRRVARLNVHAALRQRHHLRRTPR